METREKIIQAADQLFGQVGYDAASTREIAELCGVNKALIHYHFKSKEALLEIILDRYYDKLITMIGESLLGDGSLMDKMKRTADAYMDFLSENRNFARTVQREASGGKHVDRIQRHMVPIFELGMEAIQREHPSTSSGDLAASQLLTSIYGMIVSYFTYSDVLRYLLGNDPLSRRELNKRKRHLYRMLEIMEAALDEQETALEAASG